MTILHQLDKWSIAHPRLLLLLRVTLGIALTWKGISFMNDTMSLNALLAQSNFSFLPDWIALVITSIHLLCGFMITIGLFTRLAALVQIPILIGAVIINATSGISPTNELVFSLLILLLLIFFAFEGGGELSLDDFKENHFL